MPRFSATLLDHARHPRNAGEMPSPDAVGSSDPDNRGPQVWLFLRIAEGRVIEALFQSMGCGCTIACCSILTELLKGRLLGDCDHITAKSIAEGLGGIPPDKFFSAELAMRAPGKCARRLGRLPEVGGELIFMSCSWSGASAFPAEVPVDSSSSDSSGEHVVAPTPVSHRNHRTMRRTDLARLWPDVGGGLELQGQRHIFLRPHRCWGTGNRATGVGQKPAVATHSTSPNSSGPRDADQVPPSRASGVRWSYMPSVRRDSAIVRVTAATASAYSRRGNTVRSLCGVQLKMKKPASSNRGCSSASRAESTR